MPDDSLALEPITKLLLSSLDRCDVALLNLRAARGLPGTESLEEDSLLSKLDEWAQQVRFDIWRHLYRIERQISEPPTEFSYGNSLGRFFCWYMLQVLQEDCGVVYHPDRKFKPDFCQPDFARQLAPDDPRYEWLHALRSKQHAERQRSIELMHEHHMEQLQRRSQLPGLPTHPPHCSCWECEKKRDAIEDLADSTHSPNCQCRRCTDAREQLGVVGVAGHFHNCNCHLCRQERNRRLQEIQTPAFGQQPSFPGAPFTNRPGFPPAGGRSLPGT